MKNKIELIPVNEFGSEITVGGYGFDKFIEKPKQEINEQAQMYSEEEVLELLHRRMRHTLGEDYKEETTSQWFEQSKKKMHKVSKRFDYLESVAEEIQMATGIKTKVVVNPTNKFDAIIIADTISGELTFSPMFDDIMQDFYRFIYVYGTKLANYGVSKRINTKEK